MEITYFEVYLKDGTTFDFDYKCNKVDYVKYILTKELWSTFAKFSFSFMEGVWYYEVFFSGK